MSTYQINAWGCHHDSTPTHNDDWWESEGTKRKALASLKSPQGYIFYRHPEAWRWLH